MTLATSTPCPPAAPPPALDQTAGHIRASLSPSPWPWQTYPELAPMSPTGPPVESSFRRSAMTNHAHLRIVQVVAAGLPIWAADFPSDIHADIGCEAHLMRLSNTAVGRVGALSCHYSYEVAAVKTPLPSLAGGATASRLSQDAAVTITTPDKPA